MNFLATEKTIQFSHGAQCFRGHGNCWPHAPILFSRCLDYTSCVAFGPLCAWGHMGCVLAGTPHSGEEAGPCKTGAPWVVVQAFPSWNLDLGVKSSAGKIIFLQVIFEGSGCGRALLCEYISIHGKPKWYFLAQDTTQCCKDCKSCVYACSTNMMHTFYLHELVLPMTKSRNASLNGFTYIICLCCCYHFLLAYENCFQHLLDTSPWKERAHNHQIQLLTQLVTKEAAGHLR